MISWKAISDRKKYNQLLTVGVLFVASSLWITVQYVPTFETREGFVPYDPFMDYLPIKDVSTMIFVLLYGSVIFGFYFFLQKPKLLLMVLYSFGFMYWIRTLCIALVPFNEPANLIPLSDPFIEQLGIYQTFIKRDLFFSGHFASVFIPYLILRKETKHQWLLAAGSILIGIGVMLQHIHYSYDVIGAAVFSYVAVICADKLITKFYPQTAI